MVKDKLRGEVQAERDREKGSAEKYKRTRLFSFHTRKSDCNFFCCEREHAWMFSHYFHQLNTQLS
jgi:hypothetical protein